MNIIKLFAIVSIGGFLFLTMPACAPKRMNIEKASEIEKYGSTPTITGSHFPYALNCSRVQLSKTGATWRNLTIGVSTFDDVLKELSPASSSWDHRYGHVVIESTLPLREGNWGFIEACFSDDLVSALNVYPLDYPGDIYEWLEKYGKPNTVTWGYFFNDRSVIWFEHGILAVIDIDYQDTRNIILFSPIDRENFENNWVIDSLPLEGVQIVPENPEITPSPGLENPWESIIEGE